MKRFIVCLVLYLLFFNPIGQYNSESFYQGNKKRELGEFVKDIPIPELNFKIPSIYHIKKTERLEFFSLEGGFFPMEELDIYFYTGDFPDLPPETAPLLMETWKLGGTKKLPDSKFIERLEFLGIQLSWKPGYEKSILSLSYMEKDAQELEELLNDWLLNPRLTNENFQIAKSQLREAIRRRNDSVAGIGVRKAKERFYEGHLRGRSESLASLEKVTLQDLQEYYKRILGTPLIRVLYSGYNRREKTLEFWENWVQITKSINIPETKDIDYLSWKKKLQESPNEIYLIPKDTNQSMVVFTGIMPPHNHSDFYSIQLLNYILGGGGFNSYLMNEIRNNRGLAYSTVSYVVFEKTHGLFIAYTLTKNESLNEVIKLMQEILSSQQALKISEFELIRAKNAIMNQFVFLFENRASVLSNQIRFIEHSMPKDYLEKYRENIQKVQLSDLHRVGKEYFSPGSFRITVVGPKELQKNLKDLGMAVSIRNLEN